MSAAEVFPVHFDPSRLEGPRAHQHPKRNDAFQQLVGDGLREVFGNRVSVAPTEGRDGSIDIFVDVADAHAERYHGLPLPLIVECKDHDDGSPRVNRNVYAGWAEMQSKLAATAAEGWPGKYAPWKRAKGYLYCVSAVLSDQQVRDDLTRGIINFFNGLPERQKPPIEQVRVMDWSDLRGWLDGMQRVVDRWRGVRVETILPHDRYLERLTGFRTFLLPEHLSFVAPPKEIPLIPTAYCMPSRSEPEREGSSSWGPEE